MPRITYISFWERHDTLKHAWEICQTLFAVIPHAQQLDVHQYYRPTEDLTDEQLREHWKTIGTQDKSLPNRASKAFLRMKRIYGRAFDNAHGDVQTFNRLLYAVSRDSVMKPPKRNQVPVMGVARPQPDVQKLAMALKLIAVQMAEEHEDEVA